MTADPQTVTGGVPWPEQPMADGPVSAPPDPAAAFPEPPPASWVTPDGHTEYDGPGTTYLLHFDPPMVPYEGAPNQFCAFHYRGHADPGRLDARLREEASGGSHAAKIVQAQIARGGTVRVTRTEPGGYDTERRLKQHGASRDCPEPDCVARAQAAAARAVGHKAARRAESQHGFYAAGAPPVSVEHGWERAAAEALGKAGPDAATWQASRAAEAELEAEAG